MRDMMISRALRHPGVHFSTTLAQNQPLAEIVGHGLQFDLSAVKKGTVREFPFHPGVARAHCQSASTRMLTMSTRCNQTTAPFTLSQMILWLTLNTLFTPSQTVFDVFLCIPTVDMLRSPLDSTLWYLISSHMLGFVSADYWNFVIPSNRKVVPTPISAFPKFQDGDTLTYTFIIASSKYLSFCPTIQVTLVE